MKYRDAFRRTMRWVIPAWLIFAVGIPVIFEPRPEPHWGHLISFDLAVGTLILLAGAIIISTMEQRQDRRQ